MRRAKLLAAALAGVLVASLAWGAALVDQAGRASEEIVEARKRGWDEGQEVYRQQILDRPVTEGRWMPLWLQTDPQWAEVPYLDGTIGSHGCGLTCAAMAIKYLTLEDVTPSILAGYVGDDCSQAGLNDMDKFGEWVQKRYAEYEVEWSGERWSLDEALSLVDDGWVVMAGMSGPLGAREYGSHIVLIWGTDGVGNYWIRDPDDAQNSSRAFSRDELAAVEWGSFNGLRGGLYGA